MLVFQGYIVENSQASYDVGKGVSQLTDALSRLSTFQHLHATLKTDDVGEDLDTRAQVEESPDGAALTASLRRAKSGCRRLSFSMCDVGGSPRHGAMGSGARKMPLYQSAADAQEAPIAVEIEAVGRGIVERLQVLASFEGRVFYDVWQHFLKTPLQQICSSLAASGFLSEAFSVLGRHACDFQSDDVMDFIESLPVDLTKEQENQLPYWIIQQAIPSLTCRDRLLRWLP